MTREPVTLLGGNQEAVAEQVADLRSKGAIEPAPLPLEPGFYSRLFVVPKASGGWRPVIDLSALNRYLKIPSFRMETHMSILAALEGSRYAASVDLQDAYLHVPMHPRARPYLRFVHQQQVWQFKALPFGLSTAPFVFTWMLRPFLRLLRARGIRIHAYLDDWVIHHPVQTTLESHVQQVLRWAAHLGLIVNQAKSQLTPSQHFVYLGIELDLAAQLVQPPPDKCLALQQLIRQLSARPSSARRWATLLGRLNFVSQFVPLGRLHLRPLQRHLAFAWDQDWKTSHLQLIPVPQALLPHLQWWGNLDNLRLGVQIAPPPPTATLFTDASNDGWGAHLLGEVAHGRWTPSELPPHINCLEMLAISRAVQAFEPRIRGSSILIASDNTTVLAYLRKQGGTVSHLLTQMAGDLLRTLDEWETTISLRHVPGRRNVLADLLSRSDQTIPSEWTLNQEVLDWLWRQCPRPKLDAFATCLNARLDRYWSPVPDPHAEGTDAMSQPWDKEALYMFPPNGLIPAVLRKLQRQPHSLVVLIVPWNEGAPWFPVLLDLVRAPGNRAITLPALPDLLFQPLSGDCRPDASLLSLTACVLSSTS